jgi:hypothetical protein
VRIDWQCFFVVELGEGSRRDAVNVRPAGDVMLVLGLVRSTQKTFQPGGHSRRAIAVVAAVAA